MKNHDLTWKGIFVPGMILVLMASAGCIKKPKNDAEVAARGTVTNLVDGSPLSGATVQILDEDGAKVSLSATSDASGNYELSLRRWLVSDSKKPKDWVAAKYTLQAKASGFLDYPYSTQPVTTLDMANVVVETGEKRQEIYSLEVPKFGLIRQIRIRGGVNDLADASPIAGTQVTIVDAAGKAVGKVQTTNTAGAYESAVPQMRDANGTGSFAPAVYTLKAQMAGYFEFPSDKRPSPSFAMASVKTGVLENDTTQVALIRQVTLRGQVSGFADASGVPVPFAGVSVVAIDANGTPVCDAVLTDAAGQYTLTVPQLWDLNGDGMYELGVYTIKIDSDDYQSLNTAIQPDQQIDMSTAVEEQAPDGSTILVIHNEAATNTVLAPTVHIRGIVVDVCSPPNPIPGAIVEVMDALGVLVTSAAITDAQGNYDLAVPQYWVTPSGCEIVVPDEGEGEVAVEGEGEGEGEGEVVPEGEGEGEGESPIACEFLLGVYSLRVNAEGYQAFPTSARPADPLTMPVAASEGEGEAPAELVVENESTTIALLPLIDLSGQVVDYVGNVAIAGAQVWAGDDAGADAAGPVITDAQGQFTVQAPQFWDADGDGVYTVGTYSLRVVADGYWPFPSNLTPSASIDLQAEGVAECGGQGVTSVTLPSPIRLVREVLLRGMVTRMDNDDPIEHALVQATDINDTPVGSTAETDANGDYELTVPQLWDLDGVLGNEGEGEGEGESQLPYGDYRLRSQAMYYQEFPTAIRPSLPIDMEIAELQESAEGEGEGIDDWVIDETISTLTHIKLIPLAGDTSQLGSIAGHIESNRNAGVLVVAERSVTEAFTGLSGFDGNYMIFNVPPGTYTVNGYALGVQLNPATNVAVAASETKMDVNLTESSEPLSTVSGNVTIVNAPGGSLTSVVLAVESTFNESVARGIVPPGLRVGEISGAFTIPNVPRGRYVVLAAFENDGLVRDPDPNIAGTQILHLEVPEPGPDYDITIPDSFKITEALAVVTPGAEGPEAISSPTPNLEWADDSSEEGYTVWVLDSFGNEIWRMDLGPVSGQESVSVPFDQDGSATSALIEGMYYQFRAQSWKEDHLGVRGPISMTEDLRGVFFLQTNRK